MITLRTLIFCGLFITLLVLAFDYLACVASVVYTYVWWMAPEVHYSIPSPSTNETIVPKIIHQTWKNENIPEKWKLAQQSCRDMHPDYEYRLWTDDDAIQFIKSYYPWFLSTFLSYPHPIQRADAIRYFVLHKLGGVYIDLDVECLASVEPSMQKYEFTAPATYPVGISNDILAAAPGSKFLSKAITQLALWNRWLGPPYVQIMFSTGPMFLTVQYALYQNKHDVAILPPYLYGKYDHSGGSLFAHLHGSSWHQDDAAVLLWVDRYHTPLIASILCICMCAGVLLCRKVWIANSYQKNLDIELGKKLAD